MEAKTMTSEIERGSVQPSPGTNVADDQVRPKRPDLIGFEPTAHPAWPAGAWPIEPTGDEGVDEAMARLEELGALPVARHVEVFQDVHRGLQDVLAGIDQDGSAGLNVPVPRPPGQLGQPLAGRPGGG
jgi:hypothetical protein